MEIKARILDYWITLRNHSILRHRATRKVSLRKERLSKHQEAKEVARSEGKDYFRQTPLRKRCLASCKKQGDPLWLEQKSISYRQVGEGAGTML